MVGLLSVPLLPSLYVLSRGQAVRTLPDVALGITYHPLAWLCDLSDSFANRKRLREWILAKLRANQTFDPKELRTRQTELDQKIGHVTKRLLQAPDDEADLLGPNCPSCGVSANRWPMSWP